MKRNEISVIFMGTPQFAIPSLNILLEDGFHVSAVVTQPDRPVGRRRILTPTPVKEVALEHGLLVLQPERLRSPEAVATIAELKPDLIVTAAYGQILPKALLELPRLGCINVHASLLPRYRGGAPIQHAIMNGDEVTGVTIMYMAEGLDTGDMISKVEVPILETDDAGSMFTKLSDAGAELLRQTLPDLIAGRCEAVAQNEQEASYAPNISRDDERIIWQRGAKDIFNQVRALHPQPVAFTTWAGERLKIWTCALEQPTAVSKLSTYDNAVPGTVLQCEAQGIEVKTGDGSLWLTKIQPAGKKAMDVADFVRGSELPPGTILGGERL